MARAITLIESSRPDHRDQAEALLASLHEASKNAIFIGLSGTPGVGESTFIDRFGTFLTDQGLKVAVLAVDPTSARSGGSILGDKTRMPELSRNEKAYIRPSPAGAELGGVARRTREASMICAAAGFDVVIIETVGVGQSEVAVGNMSDAFILLLAPAGGDELQGVKRGIMEIADLVVVNKADGDLKPQAIRTCADYAGALRLMRSRSGDPEGFPSAQTASALTGDGIKDIWASIQTLIEGRKENGIFQSRRADQAQAWFQAEIRSAIDQAMTSANGSVDLSKRLAQQVRDGQKSPSAAAHWKPIMDAAYVADKAVMAALWKPVQIPMCALPAGTPRCILLRCVAAPML